MVGIIDSGYKTFINEDFGFKVKIINSTPLPQRMVYIALHHCHHPFEVDLNKILHSEEYYGEVCVKRLLAGGRGHFQPFEAASISMGLYGIPNNVKEQLVRSRIGVTPNIQSFRVCDKKLIQVYQGSSDIEELIYLRPIGKYTSRNKDEGVFHYTDERRNADLQMANDIVDHVGKNIISYGMPLEQARGLLPFDYRSDMMFTFNARSLMAFLDRRYKKDCQMEIQVISQLFLQAFVEFMPEIAQWYKDNRLGKAMLAP